MQGRYWIAVAAALALTAVGACGSGGGQAGNTNAAMASNAPPPGANAATDSAAPPANAATNSAAATPVSGPAPPYVTALLAVLNSPHPDRYSQDPGFRKLIEANGQLAGKEGDADLDSDPVCQCQDTGGHYVYVSGATESDGSFDAKVQDTVETDGPPWTIVMKQENGAWVVYNVIDATGDVRVWLTRHNDCMRRIHGDDNALLKCFGGGT
jgi:hypothetical protein